MAVIDGRSASIASEKSVERQRAVAIQQPAAEDLGDVDGLEQQTVTRSRQMARAPGAPAALSRSSGSLDAAALHRAAGSADGRRSRAAGRAAAAAGRGCPASCPLRSSDGRLAISSCVYGWRGAAMISRDRRDLDQPAGVHHAEPVDELRHQAHVVADQDHRRAELLLHARRASP